MPRKSQKAKLIFDEKQKEQLKTISQSRKAPIREVQRANILLRYSEDIPITEIENMVQVSRPTIYKWIEKALAMGIQEGLKDKYHRPKEPVITEEAKAWVIGIA